MEQPRYKDMTADERFAAHSDQSEAARLHQDAFAQRPFHETHSDRRAWDHMKKCEREAAFIHRVARSCGDQWANP